MTYNHCNMSISQTGYCILSHVQCKQNVNRRMLRFGVYVHVDYMCVACRTKINNQYWGIFWPFTSLIQNKHIFFSLIVFPRVSCTLASVTSVVPVDQRH